MQEAADRRGRGISLEVSTHHPRMAAWIMDDDKGKGVFQWDETEFNGNALFARKEIKPRF